MTWKKTKDCFSKEEVNRKRQPELDIVKGLAIIFMVFCHPLFELGADTSTWFGIMINEILGGPFSAPIFMLCMGIGISYSRRSNPKTLLKRGIQLFIFGYLLNFVRYTLPSLVAYGITHDSSYLSNWLNCLLTVDILPFAGLTFMIAALWKKLRINWWYLFGLAITLLITAPIIKDKGTNIEWLDLILGLFWKTNADAYFTLFHWLIIPVVGIKVGELLLHLEDKRTIYCRLILIVFPISFIFEVAAHLLNIGLLSDDTEYYYFTLLDAIFLIGSALAWISIFGLIMLNFKTDRVPFLSLLSKHINQIYCIHWGILGFLAIFLPMWWNYEILPYWAWFLISICILFISLGLAVAWDYLKKEIKENVTNR